MPLVNVTNSTLVQARERSVVLNYLGTDPLHIMCVEDGFDHNVDPTLLDAPSVCDPAGQVIGPTRETITVRLMKTTGADGSLNRLLPLRKTTTTISWVDEGDQAVGTATNPEFHGIVRIPDFSFSNGKAGEPQYFDLTMPVVGQILPNTSGTPIYTGHHGIL